MPEHHQPPSDWSRLAPDRQLDIILAITERIEALVGDSVPWNKRLAPVQSGSEYLRRCRCILMAQDLVDAAEDMGIIGMYEPDIMGPCQWKTTINAAQAFLEFQRDQWFECTATMYGAEYAAEAEAELQRMEAGPVEEFRHRLEQTLGDGQS